MGSREEIVSSRLRAVLSKHLDLPEEELSPDRSLREDLDLDSMSLLEIIMKLEEAFGVEIDQRQADKFKTIQDVCKYLLDKGAA